MELFREAYLQLKSQKHIRKLALPLFLPIDFHTLIQEIYMTSMPTQVQCKIIEVASCINFKHTQVRYI